MPFAFRHWLFAEDNEVLRIRSISLQTEDCVDCGLRTVDKGLTYFTDGSAADIPIDPTILSGDHRDYRLPDLRTGD